MANEWQIESVYAEALVAGRAALEYRWASPASGCGFGARIWFLAP
jgi:hypothetical protein